MKKIYTIILLIVFGIGANANPILLPYMEISELYFDDNNHWILELAYYEIDEQDDLSIDSIFLFSNSDTIKLPMYEFVGSNGVFVYTQDSLDSEFIINRHSDLLTIYSYCWEQSYEDQLNFGDGDDCEISYPREGQSISRFYYYFTKDNSPTLGEFNDDIGIFGTISGTIYDMYLEPIPNRLFRLESYPNSVYFETSSDGGYVFNALSKTSSFNHILHKPDQTHYNYLSITEITYTMEPDSVISMDIYLLDTLQTSIPDLKYKESPISIFPNPVLINSQFNIKVDLPVLTSNISFEIYDINGKLIKSEKVMQNEFSMESPTESGVYVMVFKFDDQIISSEKILVK